MITTLKKSHIPPRYGITEQKKQELDNLSQEVLDAQNNLNHLTAIVNSLTDKSAKLQTKLDAAEADKDQALDNKNAMEDVAEKLLDLVNNSNATFNACVLADAKVKKVAASVNIVINKLIYSAEVINKLSNLIIRKKAVNPLISDSIVNMITTAGTDANNAVALTLTALQSIFTAQGTSLEAESSSSLQILQATKLYEYFIGEDVNDIENQLPDNNIKTLLIHAYEINVIKYNNILKAYNDNLRQLNEAQRQLSDGQVNLNSLEAGLAAANAAALAS